MKRGIRLDINVLTLWNKWVWFVLNYKPFSYMRWVWTMWKQWLSYVPIAHANQIWKVISPALNPSTALVAKHSWHKCSFPPSLLLWICSSLLTLMELHTPHNWYVLTPPVYLYIYITRIQIIRETERESSITNIHGPVETKLCKFMSSHHSHIPPLINKSSDTSL